jgi:hypothetical protein
MFEKCVSMFEIKFALESETLTTATSISRSVVSARSPDLARHRHGAEGERLKADLIVMVSQGCRDRVDCCGTNVSSRDRAAAGYCPDDVWSDGGLQRLQVGVTRGGGEPNDRIAFAAVHVAVLVCEARVAVQAAFGIRE